ncbi:hypothetical protein [Lysinibacillus fusiformis]|uniref:hypothetical protein n=1 Tax=Lysinibacillus fusiformis TaxID=28031 RepID=UPI003D02FD02
MPTLIASYAVYSASTDTTDLVTASFTPSNGEVLVVKLATWDASNGMGAVSGGGQTYTTRITGPTAGFNGWVRIVTAVVSGSPGSMTVTAAGTAGNSRHSMVVERWTGTLAGTPAVNSTTSGSGAPSANITTAAANSAVSWVSVDVASQDPTTRAYRLSGVEDLLFDGHVGANSVHYGASVADVGAAGTYAMGMTAPGSQTWVLAGIEIQAGAGSVSGTATGTVGGLIGTATGIREVAATTTGAVGGVSGTANGVRQVTAVASGTAGGLTGTVTGLRTVAGATTATVGGLTGLATAARTTFGTAAGTAGGITGTASVAALVEPGRLTPSLSGPRLRPSTGGTRLTATISGPTLTPS